MTGILAGLVEEGFKGEEINPFISNELNEYTEATYAPTLYLTQDNGVYGPYSKFRSAPQTRWQLLGSTMPAFKDDFYYRIHITPSRLDLQTVASSQTRQFTLWNAWPATAAQLTNVTVSNPVGIEIIGQAYPYTMQPLEELTYSATVGISGPPNINVDVQFDFSNVTDPLPLLIVGTRAVKFDIVPEIPVSESWEWLSDMMTAVDGTEQRIALRGEVPRIELGLKVKFDTSETIRNFYADLATTVGRLWVPEFQYATRTTTDSTAGGLQLYYDSTTTDIRAGEFVMVQTPTETVLLGIDVLNASGATVVSTLGADIPAGSLIMPGSPALLSDQTSIGRYSVNQAAETKLSLMLTRQRSVLTRTGSAVTLPTFLGSPVMDKRPLANGLVNDEFSTGQISLDNQTGLPDLVSYWDYTRIGGPRTFKVNRMQTPADMDYWKTFLAYCRGRARKFWVPTYRDDMELTVTPSDATATYTIKGTSYAEKIWPIVTHKYIEIETASGIHRTQIAGASVTGTDTILNLSTALPTGAGWINVKRISYLLPCRLGDDKAEWKHFGLESMVSISIRTAEV
jgi:hypothetical protein